MKTLTIQISNKERLIADNNQWTYQILEKAIDKKTGERRWKSEWFYSSLQAAYCDLLDSLLMTSKQDTIKEALKETVEKIEAIKKEINK